MKAFWEGLKGLMGRILGSRKMVISVIALAVMIASFLAPELGERIERIGGYGALILLVLTANGTIELGDLVAAWAARPVTIQAAIDNITTELKPTTTAPATTTTTSTVTSTPMVAQPMMLIDASIPPEIAQPEGTVG